MRFAILGYHPDAWTLAQALQARGTHEILWAQGTVRTGSLATLGDAIRFTTDPEEVLADDRVEAVIVAGPPDHRFSFTRRALQSGRHVLCVHPIDSSLAAAHEIEALADAVRRLVVPIFPAWEEMAEWPELPRGESEPWEIVELEVLSSADGFCGSTLAEALAGPIASVQACAAPAAESSKTLAVQGVFANGALLRMLVRRHEPSNRIRLRLRLRGQWTELTWLPHRNPYAEVWRARCQALETRLGPEREGEPRSTANPGGEDPKNGLSWSEEIAALEMGEALSRALTSRRAEEPQRVAASAAADDKSRMTALGCALVATLPLWLVLAVWKPALFWLMPAVLIGFLLLQLFGWATTRPQPPGGR